MRFLKLFLILNFFIISSVFADIGCNLGREIYPFATGQVTSSGLPIYSSSYPITIRTWNNDPNCGILNSKIVSQNKQCVVGNNSFGTLYYYNASDNNCQPVNVPIDTLALLGLLSVGIMGYYFITRKISI